ncbi:hypothetical protein [Bradyrhizobium sp. DASA03007]|uniref:hypothetical protein n=1 Tax=unclassified Bradyrhizobium TaxID=2631580 RepID=UPI003F70A705
MFYDRIRAGPVSERAAGRWAHHHASDTGSFNTSWNWAATDTAGGAPSPGAPPVFQRTLECSRRSRKELSDVYPTASGNSSLDQGRPAPGQMLLKSSFRVIVLAEADVMTRMFVTRIEVKDIDAHLLSRNVHFCARQLVQSAQA